MHARIGLPPQIVIRLQQNLKEPRQVFLAEQRRGFRDRRPLIRCCGNQLRIRAAHSRDQEVAHVPDRFAAEVLQIAASFLKRMHESQCAVGRTGRNRSNEFLQRVFRHHAQKCPHLVIGNRVAAIRPRLLQK